MKGPPRVSDNNQFHLTSANILFPAVSGRDADEEVTKVTLSEDGRHETSDDYGHTLTIERDIIPHNQKQFLNKVGQGMAVCRDEHNEGNRL